jgi:hypothetical protein
MPLMSRPVRSRTLFRLTSAGALAVLFLGGPLSNSAQAAATVPPLGTATAFSVLAGSTVTNTGPTTISRSVGLHPGTAVTGSGTMVVGGTYHVADPVALTAKNNLTTAYNNAAGQTPRNAEDAELGGETLVGGVYNRAAAMALTGALTLDGGHGDNSPSDSVWVFQAGSTLTTASASSVVLTRGANPCNVFWQVGSSATLGTTTTFVGTIMANQSITMNTGATLQGRALARVAAVNLHNNVITTPACAGDTDVPTGTTTPPPPAGTGGTGGTGGGGGGTGTNGGTGGGGGGTQVHHTPKGAVDTGYAGPVSTSNRGPDAWLSVSVLGIFYAGVVALVVVRRRRRV